MVSTITATNRLSITKAETRINGTKNSHACGYTSITGRTMPIDQLSSVMTWNKVYSESPRLPNHSGKRSPKSVVAITAPT